MLIYMASFPNLTIGELWTILCSYEKNILYRIERRSRPRNHFEIKYDKCEVKVLFARGPDAMGRYEISPGNTCPLIRGGVS